MLETAHPLRWNPDMKTTALLGLACVSLVATGCSVSTSSPPNPSLHSASIETNQMVASFSAQSGDSNVKVYASLFAKNDKGNNTGVTLDQGDSLVVTVAGSAPITMTAGDQEPSSSAIPYSATLPYATDAEDITVALVRSGSHVGAPRTVIHLPAPFTLTTSVPKGARIKLGATIAVKVAPPPTGGLAFEVAGPCVSSSGNDGLTPPAFDVQGNGDIATSQVHLDGTSACDVAFYIDELGQNGTLDPAYKGGLSGVDQAFPGTSESSDVVSEQRRAVTITMQP